MINHQLKLNYSELIPAKNNPGQYYMDCPFCLSVRGKPDTDHKLGVNTNFGVFNCFKCGTRGHIDSLDELEFFTSNGDKESTDPSILRKRMRLVRSSEEVDDVTLDQVAWPVSMQNTPMAYSYLMSRGFSDSEIQKYQLYVGHSYLDKTSQVVNRWSGRIIFPIIVRQRIVGLVGRTTVDARPKYLNTRLSRNTVLYNIDNIKSNTVIVCEGIVSSIAAERSSGVGAVATLGKYISDSQMDLIRSIANDVYFSLDGDVDSSMLDDMYHRALQRGFNNVYHVPLPQDKDPDDLGRNFIYYLKNSRKIRYGKRKNNYR